MAGAAHIDHRQLTVLGPSGEGAVYTGAAALEAHNSRSGTDCVAAGNLTVTPVTENPALTGRGDSAQAGVVADWAGTSAGGVVDYGTEGGLLERALGGTVVVCGPGDMAQAHQADEFIEAGQLDGAVAFLRRLVRGYCGAALRPYR